MRSFFTLTGALSLVLLLSGGVAAQAPLLGLEGGWVSSIRDAAVQFTCDADQRRIRFPLRGGRLGLETHIPVGEDITGQARATWFVPSHTNAHEALGVFPVWPDGSRTWKTEPQWYTFEGNLQYHPSSVVGFVAGFRFDSFETDWKKPRDQVGDAGLASDEADFSLKGFIPYIGLQIHQGPELSLRLVGCPVFPGNVKYKETRLGRERWEGAGPISKGYFIDFVGEWSPSVLGGSAALFIQYTLLHATAPFNITSTTAGLARDNFTLAMSVHAPILTVGGRLELAFKSPL